MSSRHQGFTFLELLLVLTIIAVVALIVIVSLHPSEQMSNLRNAQRKSDVSVMMNAFSAYLFDHQNARPAEIPTTATGICRSLPTSDCTRLVNLSALTGAVLRRLPVDPLEQDPNATGYTIVEINGRITIRAALAEGSDEISVTR